MPETREELAADSRWPAFFPSPICITTTEHHGIAHLEKVVGASIVNRFPYVVALSFCREGLSPRHYVRRTFMDALEASGRLAVQFLMPGESLARVMAAIANLPEDEPADRFIAAGLATRDALSRVETMVLMAGYDLPLRAIRQQVASALDLIIHLERLHDGGRRVTTITEVQRMESDVITMQDLFRFHVDSIASNRSVVGSLTATGLRPTFGEKFEKRGVELPAGIFGPSPQQVTQAMARSASR